MDSDTESESQVSVGGWDATEFAHIATTQALLSSQDGSQDAEPSSVDVEQAVHDLQSLDLEVVEKDEASHDVIQVASTTILSYLEHVVNASPPEGVDIQDIQTATSAILNPEFVALLFTYRQVFHAIAARSIRSGSVCPAVVCWVDVVFAKIAVAITVISPGVPSSASQSEQVHGGMQKQLDCHLLRAATQLPSTWAALPTVLSIGHASPAACRLALHLLYGMYVLRPRLLGHKSPQITGADRDRLFAALRSYLGRTPQMVPTLVVDYADLISTQERIACAMFLALFAVMDMQVTGQGRPPFRPSTEAALLRYIMTVLCPMTEPTSDEELITPSASLDTAQAIFLWHPQTISWCWKVWSDQRVAHAEIIDYVTVTWLRNVGCQSAYDDSSSWDDEGVLIAIRTDTTVACSTLLRFINRSLRLMIDQRPSPPTLDAVRKAVYFCSSHLLTDDELSGSHLIEELCSTLQKLFFHLTWDDTAAVTKDAILEGLSWVGVETMRTATEKAFGHASVLKVKLEHSVAALARLIANAENELLESADITNLRQLLQFLTLVWQSGAELDDAFGQMMAPLLRDLVDWLSCDIASCHDGLTLLRSSCALVLSTSCASGTESLVSLVTGDAVWEMLLAETGRPIDLVLASAFATYVCATYKQHDRANSVLYACGWDYLRDALLLILNDHFLDVGAPLAILVAPSICLALASLVVSADERIASYVLSSPWTMSLCTTLQDILQSTEDGGGDIYYQHLSKIVRVPATELLKEIKYALSAKGSTPTELPVLAELHCKTHLVSVRLRGRLQLFLAVKGDD